MIPYSKFSSSELASIDISAYDSISLPAVHYRAVRAIKLNERFVLIKDKGIFDRTTSLFCARPDKGRDNSVTFQRGARLAGPELTPFISPFKLKVVSGIWALEEGAGLDRLLIYRDGMSTQILYNLSAELIKLYHENVEGLGEYVDALDISKEIDDHSFDLCTQCGNHTVDHLPFHVCRGEIGSRLLTELTGMTRDDILGSGGRVVKKRLYEMLLLLRGSTTGGVRLTLDVSPSSELYYASECPWSMARPRLEWR